MATIRFYLKPQSGAFAVMAKISNGVKNEKAKSLGYTVSDKKKHWDEKRQRARNCDNAADINTKISRWEMIFQNHVAKVNLNEEEFDFEQLIAAFSGKTVDKRDKNVLVVVAKDFYKSKSRLIDLRSAAHYEVLIRDIEAYQSDTGTTVKLAQVKKTFYEDFGQWLVNKKANINNTVNKKISRIITIMDWAFEHELVATQFYKAKYSFKGNKPSSYPPLLPEEIKALAQAKTSTESQALSLSAFIFACETGLRISDIYQLNRKHIKQAKDGDGILSYIDFTQEKTTNATEVPLNSRALEILDRMPKTGLVFNIPEEHYVNRFLKIAAKQVKLTREIEHVFNKGNTTVKEFSALCDEISFHCARSSYITNSLAAGINPVFVMSNAGHSDLKITMGYSKQDKLNRMKETLKVQNKS